MFARLPRLDQFIATPGGYIALFLLGCLGTLSLLGFLLGGAYRQTEKQAETDARNTVEILEAQVNATLRRLQTDLEEIAATVPREAMRQDAMPRYVEEITSDLILHTQRFPEIVGYRILDATGNMLYSSQPDMPRVSAQGRGFFEELRANPQKGLTFSEVVIGRATPRPLVFAAVPVLANDGKFLGVAVAPIDLEYFRRLLDAIDLGKNGVISFRRSDDGRLVFRQPEIPGTVNRSLPDNPVLARIAAGERGGILHYAGRLDGIDRTYAYRRVGDYPYYIAAGIAAKDYLVGWRSTAVAVLAVSAGILLVLAVVMWRLTRIEAKERRTAEELRKSEAMYRTLLEGAPFPVVIAGLADGNVKYLNRRACQWLDIKPDEVLGQSIRDLYQKPESRDRILASAKEQGEVRDHEVELRPRRGEPCWALVSMQMIEFEGQPATFTAFSDISGRKSTELAMRAANQKLLAQVDEIERLQAALQEQAIRDGLTGLYNRRYLDETLERELARARRENSSLALVMLDIDHFKKINDTYGHQAGDQVLKALAAQLVAEIRAEDVPCRYGGEEFLVLLPGMPLAAAVERAEAWCRAASELCIVFGDLTLRITISFGIAAYPDHADMPDRLTQCADRALYCAKHEGRNRVAVCRG